MIDNTQQQTNRPTDEQGIYDIQIKIYGTHDDGLAVELTNPEGRNAAGIVEWQFSEKDLVNVRKALELRLLRSRSSRRRSTTIQNREMLVADSIIENFGKALFESIVNGEIANLYFYSIEKAAESGKIPRVQLIPSRSSVASLPLELMVDMNDHKLALRTDRMLVRCIESPLLPFDTKIDLPVRILAVISNPQDPRLDNLDITTERAVVDSALEELVGAGIVKLEWLENPTWHEFRQKLSSETWHVLHFVGHGHYNEDSKKGAIAFTKPDMGLNLVKAESFGDAISANKLRFVLLNTCEGAKASSDAAYSSTAATLMRQQIPAVLAMQYEISDDAAIKFSHIFYQEIASGTSLEQAVTSARMELSDLDSTSYEWITPVLYLNSNHSGKLFDFDREKIEYEIADWHRRITERKAWRRKWELLKPIIRKRARKKYRELVETKAKTEISAELTQRHQAEADSLNEQICALNATIEDVELGYERLAETHEYDVEEAKIQSTQQGYWKALDQLVFQWKTVGMETSNE